MKFGNGVRLLGLAIVVAAVASCSRDDSAASWTDDSGLLKYVPADTPYLFAQINAPPDELMDKLEPWAESVMAGYLELMRAMIEEAGGDPTFSRDEFQRASALLDAAAELLTAEGLENTGITRDSKTVVYGHGLLPVMRATLTDGALLEAAVARIEAAAGATAAVGTSGAQSYRYWGDDEVRIVMAIVGNELVLTASPVGLSDQHLGTILGGELPARNIAASGKLDEIASRYDFGPHYLGFIDVQLLVATFLDEPTGINADLLTLMAYDRAVLSDVCQSEIREMAGISPRWILGSTTMDAEHMAFNAVIELREDIAAGLGPIAAPVPGLGTLRAGLISLGMGVDLPAARDFALARLAAIEADPFECELFAELAPAIPEARAVLNQPLPPQVYDFRGFVLTLDEVGDLSGLASGQMPSEISARILVVSDDAPGLTAMGGMFSPEVAALQPDGEPVRINLPVPLPVPLDIYAALTPTTVGIAVGPDAAARLQELLAAPTAEPSPFMSGDVDVRRYYEFANELVVFAVGADPLTPARSLMPVQGLLAEFADGPIERESSDVFFTANGIEMPTTITFSD